MNLQSQFTKNLWKKLFLSLSLTVLTVTSVLPLSGIAVAQQDEKQVPEYFLAPANSITTDFPSLPRDIQIKDYPQADAPRRLRVINLGRNRRYETGAKILAQTGIIETGDILLSFRPEWGGSLAYGNIQMGVSHAAVAIVTTKNGEKIVKTVESPSNYSSYLSSDHHYNTLTFMHIVRPNLTDAQKENLEKWAVNYWNKLSSFQFYSNYADPIFNRAGSGMTQPIQLVKKLASILLGERASLETYCSEMAWAFLGLKDTSPTNFDETRLVEIFAPMPAVTGDIARPGLMEGNSAVLLNSGMSDADRINVLTSDALVDNASRASNMSTGHQKVARDFAPVVGMLRAYYANGENKGGQEFQVMNGAVKPNYSPTAFMIKAVTNDGFQYVGTVSYK